MINKMKDMRRRTVESVLSSVGASEKTVDDEFEVNRKRYKEMMDDMNEVGASLSETLRQQKSAFSELRQLASVLARVYVRNAEIDDWQCENQMLELPGAVNFSEKSDYIHNAVRSSAGLTVVETTLEPLRSAMTKMNPEINALNKIRDDALKDFDAHKRRLKSLIGKIEAIPARTENLTPDIKKFEAKCKNSEYKYYDANDKAKNEIMLAKLAHDKLMDVLLITIVVCQEELFTRAAHSFRDVIAHFPQQRVDKVRDRISRLIDDGGVQQTYTNKSTLSKGVAVMTGKKLVSEVSNDEETRKILEEERLFRQQEEASRIQDIVRNFDVEKRRASIIEASAPPPPPPVPIEGTVEGQEQVVAMWPYTATQEDELSFEKGDAIYVLDKMTGEDQDSGWWRGQLPSGVVGLFPVNYTVKL